MVRRSGPRDKHLVHDTTASSRVNPVGAAGNRSGRVGMDMQGYGASAGAVSWAQICKKPWAQVGARR